MNNNLLIINNIHMIESNEFNRKTGNLMKSLKNMTIIVEIKDKVLSRKSTHNTIHFYYNNNANNNNYIIFYT